MNYRQQPWYIVKNQFVNVGHEKALDNTKCLGDAVNVVLCQSYKISDFVFDLLAQLVLLNEISVADKKTKYLVVSYPMVKCRLSLPSFFFFAECPSLTVVCILPHQVLNKLSNSSHNQTSEFGSLKNLQQWRIIILNFSWPINHHNE